MTKMWPVRFDYDGLVRRRDDDVPLIVVGDITSAVTLREQGGIYYDADDPNLGTNPERIHKFYFSSDEGAGVSRVWVAFSADGETFGNFTECVMGASDRNSEDPDLVTVWGQPGVAHRDGSGNLHLYVENKSDDAIFVYESSDGINWTEMSGNPVIAPEASTWNDSLSGSPIARHDGTNYIIGYEGEDSTEPFQFGIAYGTTPNSLTKLAANPVWRRDDDPGITDDAIIPDTMELTKDGTSIVFLCHGLNLDDPITWKGVADGVSNPLLLTSGDILFTSELADSQLNNTDQTLAYGRPRSIVTSDDSDRLTMSYKSIVVDAASEPFYSDPVHVHRKMVKSGGSFGQRWVRRKASTFPTYSSVVLADGPIAYYRLEESSGTVAGDETGTYDGTYVGSPTLGAAGQVGDAVDFNGSSQAITTSIVSVGASRRFTFEAWVNSTTTSVVQRLAGSTSTGTSSNLQIFTNATGAAATLSAGDVLVAWRNAAGINQVVAEADCASMFDGAWHHFAVVVMLGKYQLADVEFFLDGEPLDVTYNTRVVASTASFADWTHGLAIAAVNNRGTLQNFFNGSLDEVAVYNKALRLDQVRRHYAAGRG